MGRSPAACTRTQSMHTSSSSDPRLDKAAGPGPSPATTPTVNARCERRVARAGWWVRCSDPGAVARALRANGEGMPRSGRWRSDCAICRQRRGTGGSRSPHGSVRRTPLPTSASGAAHSHSKVQMQCGRCVQSVRLRTVRVAQRTGHRAVSRAAHATMAGRSALRVRAVTTRAHTPGLGQRLAGETHERCIYLDYNATTPIFPEVGPVVRVVQPRVRVSETPTCNGAVPVSGTRRRAQ